MLEAWGGGRCAQLCYSICVCTHHALAPFLWCCFVVVEHQSNVGDDQSTASVADTDTDADVDVDDNQTRQPPPRRLEDEFDSVNVAVRRVDLSAAGQPHGNGGGDIEDSRSPTMSVGVRRLGDSRRSRG